MAAPLDQQPLAAPPSRKGLFLGMLQVALSSFGGGMSAGVSASLLNSAAG